MEILQAAKTVKVPTGLEQPLRSFMWCVEELQQDGDHETTIVTGDTVSVACRIGQRKSGPFFLISKSVVDPV